MKKKILIIFGTRPEIIKLSPLIIEFNKIKNKKKFIIKTCFTGQHSDLAISLIKTLKIKIDYSFNVMKSNQSLSSLTSKLTNKLELVYDKFQPDIVMVQGDTTSSFVGALVAFYKKIKIAHIEAGLRTYQKYSPFPEEINRKFISNIADYHFTPTTFASKQLLKENVSKKNIYMCGNTIVDACRIFSKKFNSKDLIVKYPFLTKKYILVTFHRRENFGENLINFIKILKQLANKYKKYFFVFSVHPNPNVKKIINKNLKNISNIVLVEPVEYINFTYILKKCEFIITDSGGLQEEAFYFNKCVITLRDYTERSEGLKTGKLFLTGINKQKINKTIDYIIKNMGKLKKNKVNPFGDGYSSKKIISKL